jgi:hypothetical protein
VRPDYRKHLTLAKAGARAAMLRARQAAVLLAPFVVIVFAVTSFGVLCVTPDGTGLLQAVDSRVAAAVQLSTPERARLVSVASLLLVSIVALGAAVTRTGNRRERFQALRSTLVAALVASVCAFIVSRAGPGQLGDLAFASAWSFPSLSAAMAMALALETAESFRPAAIGAAFVLSAARLTTATSWPLDEAVGAALGCGVVLIMRRMRTHAIAKRPRSRAQRAGLALAAALCAIGALPIGWSYVSILTLPGAARADQRTIEWLRDAGLSPLVDRAESWWIWRHLPSPTDTISELPAPPVDLGRSDEQALPPSVDPLIEPALPSEGEWAVAAIDDLGRARVATTTLRADPSHPSVVAAVAWFRRSSTRFTLIAGTREPGGGQGRAGARIPTSERSHVLAAFNSGYKMKDTGGGALIEGRMHGTMAEGLATLAIGSDGHPAIGEWGTQLSADGSYVGLRQSLHLLVKDGLAADGLGTNARGRWGTVKNALPTWRSAIGQTAAGDLIYVAGEHLTLEALATVLLRAGAVNAMQLDIHGPMVSLNLFTHEERIVGHKLLASMERPATRYLKPDWRDFVMVTAR